MGVGLVRSLQAPDTLWIHWRVYNSIANTRKRVLFLPPSDVYVRSFLYLLYTFSSVQFSSVAQSCLTLCDPMNHSVPGLPVHLSLIILLYYAVFVHIRYGRWETFYYLLIHLSFLVV